MMSRPRRSRSRGPARRPDRAATALLGTILLALGVGCSRGGPGEEPADTPQPSRAERIAALERSIAEDRRELENLVADPRDAGADPLPQDPALRVIVERITAERQELDELRKRSDTAADTR